MLSHLISLIDNPTRRHVIETLFREARGRKTSQLDREFLQSIGAFHTERPRPEKTAENPTVAGTAGNIPAKLSADSQAFHPLSFPRESSSPVSPASPSSPAVVSEETPAVRSPREQLQQYRGELSELGALKSQLVERRKVVTGETLLRGGNGALEVIRCLDELLCERARREEWAGIDESRFSALQTSLHALTDRELLGCEWLAQLGIADPAAQAVSLFLEPFRGKEGLVAPALAKVQRAKRDLAAVSSPELNAVREAFVRALEEILLRLRALTRTVAEEQAKRFAAISIPAKPTPAKIGVSAIPLRKRNEPWKTIPAGKAVPAGTESFFPAIQSVYPTEQTNETPILWRSSPSVSPVPRSGTPVSPVPRSGTPVSSVSPVEEGGREAKSLPAGMGSKGRLDLASLPSLPASQTVSKGAAKTILAGTKPSKGAKWGVKPDAVEESLKQAVKEQKSGKGKKKPVVLFQY